MFRMTRLPVKMAIKQVLPRSMAVLAGKHNGRLTNWLLNETLVSLFHFGDVTRLPVKMAGKRNTTLTVSLNGWPLYGVTLYSDFFAWPLYAVTLYSDFFAWPMYGVTLYSDFFAWPILLMTLANLTRYFFNLLV